MHANPPSPSTPPARSRRARYVAVGVAATFAVLLVIVAPTTIASASDNHAPGDGVDISGWRPPSHPNVTVVLEHGAWADASSWSGVVHRLQRAGYTVVAPPNPLRGLAADAAYLASYLTTLSGPIILVGHSYGGAVITNAATGNANVKALVYIDAFAPDQGESVGQLVNAQPGSVLAGDPTPVFNVVVDPALPSGDVDLYFKASVFHADFAADLTDEKSAELAATQRPLAIDAIRQLSGDPAWKHVPSWYLVGTADQVIPAAEQLAMAHRAGSHISQVNASHVSLISHPDAVARLIEDASRTVH